MKNFSHLSLTDLEQLEERIAPSASSVTLGGYQPTAIQQVIHAEIDAVFTNATHDPFTKTFVENHPEIKIYVEEGMLVVDFMNLKDGQAILRHGEHIVEGPVKIHGDDSAKFTAPKEQGTYELTIEADHKTIATITIEVDEHENIHIDEMESHKDEEYEEHKEHHHHVHEEHGHTSHTSHEVHEHEHHEHEHTHAPHEHHHAHEEHKHAGHASHHIHPSHEEHGEHDKSHDNDGGHHSEPIISKLPETKMPLSKLLGKQKENEGMQIAQEMLTARAIDNVFTKLPNIFLEEEVRLTSSFDTSIAGFLSTGKSLKATRGKFFPKKRKEDDDENINSQDE